MDVSHLLMGVSASPDGGALLGAAVSLARLQSHQRLCISINKMWDPPFSSAWGGHQSLCINNVWDPSFLSGGDGWYMDGKQSLCMNVSNIWDPPPQQPGVAAGEAGGPSEPVYQHQQCVGPSLVISLGWLLDWRADLASPSELC